MPAAPTSRRAPKVLIPSLRRQRRHPVFSAVYECEDIIAQIADAHVAELEYRNSTASAIAPFVEGVARHAGFRPRRLPLYEPVVLDDHYDLLFEFVVGLPEIEALDGLRGWRDRCDKTVLYIWELWPSSIPVFKSFYRLLDRFDHIYVGTQMVAEPLSKHLGREIRWMPPGTDVLRFTPGYGRDRPVDIFSLGRRSKVQHAESLRLRREAGWYYIHDTVATRRVDNHVEHRELTAQHLMRSKFFVSNRGKFDDEAETKGVHDFGNRFFDGTAAGAVIVGEFPRTDGFASCFDWGEIGLDLAHDDERFGERLLKLAADNDRMLEISRVNAANTARRHDWAHRWRDLVTELGLAGGEALDARLARLATTSEELLGT